ncbi:hypothetical protein LAZ67_3002052 [Cordylochernes scorpioides]|uniref:RNA-directed DNA polymerase n=1 Tax=Cordylochernes scorpioides TaxID=51811 RepID=A0ABY6K7J8_9ARAC|nr:hypothetical protein LAZ67_3002052 [Cordylochernes scorpioides]
MAQIQPPETFDFSTPNEWPKWRKRFERYLVVSGMKKKEEADKIDLFMYLMGDRADDIFRIFKFEKEEEATKIDSVLKAFDSHFCVRKNIIYERAKFNSRIQEDREPVDEFITSLYKLADSCEFEGLHEQLIRDRIVVGVRDKALSERMQLDSELTLEKAVKMVRQQEAVRQQQVDLQRPSTSQKVDQVKFNSKKQSPKQQQQPSRKKDKSAKTRSRCPKCGGFTHREGQACRAEGQKCNLCSKTGHFANCCPDKQAKTAEVKAVSELDEEIGFLLEVSAVEDSSNLDDDEGECRRRWTAEIQVNGKKVKFKLDSQADVTCVPLCLFKKIMGQQRLVKSDINLRAAEFSELQTVGMFISTLRNGNYEIKEKIYVIRRLSEPLLSRRACELLNLARRIEVVATRINPIKEFPEVFEGLGQIGNPYEIKLKLEILDKLHAGHFGITKTRLRARETVWWPGISEEIAETVRKCSVCIQEAVSKHEPLIPTNFPTRPWQKIGMDLFKFENKWYLVVIDYYSRFPEMIQLDRLTANVVVRSCKSIFARHGIPETVVSDNGTQFGAAREFANFARQYGFQHVTSSPRFPQSNGMAEAGVKIAKLILKKNQDPSLGLLEYRSTPLENGYSPAELLMGRKLRTTLPIAPENLNPKLVDSQILKRKEGRRRKDMKSRYDRRCGATDMEELSEGDTVWITDMRTWGIVKKKASAPRSYMIDTPVGTLRRNRFHLRKGDTVQYPADPSTPTFSGEELLNLWIAFIINYIMHLKFVMYIYISSLKKGDVLRTCKKTCTYVSPRDAAERDLGCTGCKFCRAGRPLAAIPTSNAAAQVRRNWADITEEVNPGAEEGSSSNAGASRTIRRPQSSAGSVPRAQEIRATRAHIADARARQASSSEEYCVYIEHSPELEPFHYLRALDRKLGGTAGVIQITKVNGHQLLGLTNRGLAERLISEGLEVEGTLLRAFPFRKRAERITVGNLPFFVGDSAVITALSPYGRVTSIAPKQMKAGPYVYVDDRRDVFITLHEGITIERLPTRLDINIKGQAWPAYLSSGIRCSRCHGQGHRRAICPLLEGLANNTRMAPPTTPAGVPPPTTSAPPQRSAA